MANSRYHLARVVRLPYQIDHGLMQAHLIIGIATGDDDGIKISSADLSSSNIDFDCCCTPLAPIAFLRVTAHDHHSGICILHRPQRFDKLGILKALLS